MPWSESINPEDHPLIGLSRPPSPEQMPAELLCPAGHRAQRFVLSYADPQGVGPEIKIPFWVCYPCTVVCRYQECKLIPGEEGQP